MWCYQQNCDQHMNVTATKRPERVSMQRFSCIKCFVMTHQPTLKRYLMSPFCLAFRATDETDLLSLWTNHGNQSFPRQRLFICEVCGSFIFTSSFCYLLFQTRSKYDALVLDPGPQQSGVLLIFILAM